MEKAGAREKARAEVILADTKPGIAPAVSEVFEYLGGGGELLRSSRDVYIKFNGVGPEPHVHTFGLVHQRSRIADHNCRIHQEFADIYRVLRPDFALIDGLIATHHGHCPTTYHADKCVVPMDLLIGGPDPLATDVVGAALRGFDLPFAFARQHGGDGRAPRQ